MSEDGHTQRAAAAPTGLRPHEDARAIVRMFQCSECSYPIREPLTLPCGNSICRRCMPASHTRTHITYPQNVGRAEGFECPLKDCAAEHSLADCSLDVVVNKIAEIVGGQMQLNASTLPQARLQLDERLHWRSVVDSNIDVMPRSRVLTGGRILAAYVMADVGELNYHSELAFTPITAGDEVNVKALDVEIANALRDVCRSELECHVCYGLMVDPVTTNCGHTFCRKCVARVLDHSNLCPACRRPMLMRPGVVSEPANKRIVRILEGLLADDVAVRLASMEQEEAPDEEWMPLFPCTLAFPQMPTFLHIFEPRYRLMIRRCMENGSRKFGMMMYNESGAPQGSLGQSQFMQYGTALFVQRLESFRDGRSLLETQGMYRFKVLEGSMVDGYHVGRIQRIDDMPLAEEEAIEAQETSGPEPDDNDFEGTLTHMSTLALLQHCLAFVQTARSRSTDWLHERVLAAYGQPPTDPALFPFWFASILPMQDREKYKLLPLTSVRERLKLTMRWMRIIEARWALEAAMRLARMDASELQSTAAASQQAQQAPENTESQPEEAPSAEAEDDLRDPESLPPSPSMQPSNPENRTQN